MKYLILFSCLFLTSCGLEIEKSKKLYLLETNEHFTVFKTYQDLDSFINNLKTQSKFISITYTENNIIIKNQTIYDQLSFYSSYSIYPVELNIHQLEKIYSIDCFDMDILKNWTIPLDEDDFNPHDEEVFKNLNNQCLKLVQSLNKIHFEQSNLDQIKSVFGL